MYRDNSVNFWQALGVHVACVGLVTAPFVIGCLVLAWFIR